MPRKDKETTASTDPSPPSNPQHQHQRKKSKQASSRQGEFIILEETADYYEESDSMSSSSLEATRKFEMQKSGAILMYTRNDEMLISHRYVWYYLAGLVSNSALLSFYSV